MVSVGIPMTGSTPPHYCAFPMTEPSYISASPIWNGDLLTLTEGASGIIYQWYNGND